MTGGLSDDDRALAAEHALGVLTGDDAREALRRVAAEPDFAAEVASWEAWLAEFADEVEAVEPPRRARRRMRERLFGRTRRRLSTLLGGIAVGAAASAAAFLLPPVLLPEGDAPEVPLAELAAQETDVRFIAALGGGRVLHVEQTVGEAPPDGDLQVWAIVGDAAPRPLGLLAEGRVDLFLPDDLVGQTPLTLAVSQEPVGGSPDPTPSGPIIATGEILP